MRNMSKLQVSVFVGIVFTLVAVSDAYFFATTSIYSPYMLLVGFTVPIVYSTGKKYILPMYLGSVIGLVTIGLFIDTTPEYITVLKGLAIPVVYLSVAVFFRQNYSNKDLNLGTNAKSYLILVGNAVMCGFIGGFVISALLNIINPELALIQIFRHQTHSIMHGIILLSLPFILMHMHPERLRLKKSIMAFLSVTLSTLIFFYLFSGYFGYLTRNYYFIIIMIPFITLPFIFSYNMLFFVNFNYLIALQVSYYEFWYKTDIDFDIFPLYSILVVCTFIFIMAREFASTIQNQQSRLERANDKISNMFSSSIGLMQLTEWMDQDNSRNKFDYLNKVFDISITIFDQFDAYFLVYRSGAVINFINASGIPVRYFETLQLKSSHFDWDTQKPVVYKNPQDNYKSIFGREYLTVKKFLSDVALDIRVPIQTSENTFGAVVFLKTKHSSVQVNDHDINNLYLFQKMVNTVYNVSALNHKTNTLKDDIVLSLIRTLELFDEYTGSHSEQVADISLKIAQKIELDSEEQSSIYWAGIVHDIGKIGVGDKIVNKHGPLTNIEFEAIKQHPIYGYNILNRSDELADIALLVKHHHEWYNGNGYPDGLKSHNIPFGAQILSIADAISAMSTHRIYSGIKSKDKIIEELQLYSDTQFNPILSRVAVELLEAGELDTILYEKDSLD